MKKYNRDHLISYISGNPSPGFTLLEVMVAMSIIAIALTALLTSQSQSISLAGEAKFNTTAALLAQSKMAEIETKPEDELVYDSGDFGEDFPRYSWEMDVRDVTLIEGEGFEDLTNFLKQIDLTVYWGEGKKYQYGIRFYHYVS